jgi:parallel beta-helix repeat protein
MTYLDSVEIYNCSQYDTFKGALRFEMAFGEWSQISNSAIHHGLGIGAHMVASANLRLVNNTFFNFKKFGINIESSNNITIDGNLVSDINSRGYEGEDGMFDSNAGILGCARITGDNCPDLYIMNNIVSGVETTGYSVYGHECGNYNKPVFRNNTAHSISGSGAIIFLDTGSKSGSDCIEGSYFNAYKCAEEGVVSFAKTNKAIFSNMVMIDNVIGAVLNVGKEGDDLWAIIRDSKFYGESDSTDCPY